MCGRWSLTRQGRAGSAPSAARAATRPTLIALCVSSRSLPTRSVAMRSRARLLLSRNKTPTNNTSLSKWQATTKGKPSLVAHWCFVYTHSSHTKQVYFAQTLPVGSYVQARILDVHGFDLVADLADPEEAAVSLAHPPALSPRPHPLPLNPCLPRARTLFLNCACRAMQPQALAAAWPALPCARLNRTPVLADTACLPPPQARAGASPCPRDCPACAA